jgi:hypothetical protein
MVMMMRVLVMPMLVMMMMVVVMGSATQDGIIGFP